MASDFLTLQQPVGEGGIESVNFFNGRLLTGDDMGREQVARRRADARVGEALGDGIAFGLEVGARPPDDKDRVASLAIQPGLAINRNGACLRLAQTERVHLSRIDSTSFAASPCTFDNCGTLAGGTYVAGEGLYLLTVAPAEIAMGRAPSNGLGGTNPYCDIDRKVEAVQFRLLEVPAALYADLPVSSPEFRNRVAYRCFGSGVLADWATALLAGGARGDGLIDAMAGYGLTPADVPLALVGFQGAADLTLLDSWAVRRPLALADPPGAFHSLIAPRRAAVGQAMFEQFQAQLQDLRGPGGGLGPISARSHFPHLPPVGILPRMDSDLARAFLAGMTIRGPMHINSATLELMVRESLTFPAIRSASEELVWLYAVAENRIAGTGPYLVFAAGNLAYRGDARFDLHRWNYANYALF
jgi:hypothetical protein